MLATILENYTVTSLETDPERYDIKRNIEKYLKDKDRHGLSELTLKGYSLQLNIFADRINKHVQEITKEDINNFLDSRDSDSNVNSKSTVETIRSILRSFFEWLKEEQIIQESPMIRIKPIKVPKGLAKALTVKELEMLRESCKTIREKALIEVLYSTGCRLSEVANINIGDVDWQNNTVKVIGKGSKERLVFFSVRAGIYIRKYLDSRSDDCQALLITERKPYRRMSVRAIQREVTHIGMCSNIGKSIHPHIFRHTMATLMLNKGCPMSVVQEILGHDDLATTQQYARVTHEHKHQSYEKYFHQ